MEDIDKIFSTALEISLKGYGSQRKLAREVGISNTYIWKLLNHVKYGSEATRRKIATALGYPGSRYEEFLNLGRRELGIAFEDDTNSATVINSESGCDDKWREKYFAELQAHDATLNALLTARQRIAEFEKRDSADSGASDKRLPKKAR